jgi:hypothetical protein
MEAVLDLILVNGGRGYRGRWCGVAAETKGTIGSHCKNPFSCASQKRSLAFSHRSTTKG